MHTLIVHPGDDTTKFLKGIYTNLTKNTLITVDITKAEFLKHIHDHNRVNMPGHGSPMGILSINQFPDCGTFIINDSMVESLRTWTNNVFIWCNAEPFGHPTPVYLDNILSR